jgi:uncharacterized membrane protein
MPSDRMIVEGRLDPAWSPSLAGLDMAEDDASSLRPTSVLTGPLADQGAPHGVLDLLFGLLFFVPFFGLAIGAATGALMGEFADYGINDDFIKQVREQVTEGTSALFLLTTSAVWERIAEEFKGVSAELIQSNLTSEQEAQLLADFGD